jgi:signal transduction histidine kinase
VGLSLVRQIMLAHGAEVTLQPHGGPEGGAVFTLRF